jgi:ElaB/YqjD/DUF883 family membrane-anchored ribosome-binding protein
MSQEAENQQENENLVEDAQALLSATAQVGGEKIDQARKRLAAAIEKAKEAWSNVQDKAVAGAKATDKAIRANPYQAVGVAVGVGLLVGYLLGRRCSSKD